MDEDLGQPKRDSWYNQQRSSLRSERSARTPPSRSHDSHPIDDFTLRDGHNRDHNAGDDDDNGRGAASSPAPVIPTRRASQEKSRRKSSAGSHSRFTSSRGRSRDGRTSSRGGRNIDEYLSSDPYGGLSEVAGADVERERSATVPSHEEDLEQVESGRYGSRNSEGAFGGLTELAGADVEDDREEERRPNEDTLEAEEEHSRPPRSSSLFLGPGGFMKRFSMPFGSRPRMRAGTPASALSITALPHYQGDAGELPQKEPLDEYLGQKTPGEQRASRFATELYTISYLIIFSILGTLARLGLQWLTFYPGAPLTFSQLWTNFAGTFVMGFLVEDQRLFREEWGRAPQNASSQEELKERRAAHGKAKKTLPPYIGLATGFCGSFTSFSSFIRDTFFALSNNLPSPINHPVPAGVSTPSTSSTASRDAGYSVMAVLAIILITISLSYTALKLGMHSAASIDRFTPTLPFRLLRKVIDPLVVVLAFGAWIGAVIMAIFPPDRPAGPQSHGSWANETWRGQAIFACVFAPLGCLLRFYASLKLNSIAPSFPLGTFAVNIFGTAVLGMCYDLQHLSLGASGIGGGRVACQILQGLMDGFCGCLTTVSTWVVELDTLKRRHAYVYGGVSVGVALGVLVAVMGSVRWGIGWSEAVCSA